MSGSVLYWYSYVSTAYAHVHTVDLTDAVDTIVGPMPLNCRQIRGSVHDLSTASTHHHQIEIIHALLDRLSEMVLKDL